MQEIREFDEEHRREILKRYTGLESERLRREFDDRRADVLREAEKTKQKVEVREIHNIDWDDPCPCGGNLLFKDCCGRRLKKDDERIGTEGE